MNKFTNSLSVTNLFTASASTQWASETFGETLAQTSTLNTPGNFYAPLHSSYFGGASADSGYTLALAEPAVDPKTGEALIVPVDFAVSSNLNFTYTYDSTNGYGFNPATVEYQVYSLRCTSLADPSFWIDPSFADARRYTLNYNYCRPPALPVPEPSSFGLVGVGGFGLVGMLLLKRRRGEV